MTNEEIVNLLDKLTDEFGYEYENLEGGLIEALKSAYAQGMKRAAVIVKEKELDEHYWSPELSNGWRILKNFLAEAIRQEMGKGEK